jgi:hypothetical protein
LEWIKEADEQVALKQINIEIMKLENDQDHSLGSTLGMTATQQQYDNNY